MKVTDVQTQKNNAERVSVFIDGEYSFSLDGVDALVLGIKVGRELSEDELSECIMSSQFAKAKDKALDMLSRKNASRKMICDMLKEKGYDDIVIDVVCDELESLGYIDDYGYAVLFLDYASEKLWGERKIRYELMQKGIDRNTIEDVFENYDGIGADKLASFIAEKYRGLDLTDIKAKQRVQRYLASHGFDFSVINESINICIENTKDDIENE